MVCYSSSLSLSPYPDTVVCCGLELYRSEDYLAGASMVGGTSYSHYISYVQSIGVFSPRIHFDIPDTVEETPNVWRGIIIPTTGSNIYSKDSKGYSLQSAVESLENEVIIKVLALAITSPKHVFGLAAMNRASEEAQLNFKKWLKEKLDEQQYDLENRTRAFPPQGGNLGSLY